MKVLFYILLLLFSVQNLAQSQNDTTNSSETENKEENKDQKRKWKKIKKIIDNLTEYVPNDYFKKNLYASIESQNEAAFCYDFDGFITRFKVAEKSHLDELLELTNCSIEENYFDYNYEFNLEKSSSSYTYSDININYKTKQGKTELEEIVSQGNAYAGHASIHLALMKSFESYQEIYSLKDDENVYAQLVALKTSKYFNKNEEAREIAETMISKELECLEKDSSSCYGRYATWAAEAMLDLYPDYALQQLSILYDKYESFYPENYFKPRHNFDGSVSYLIDENQISKEVEKQLESFQWVDKQIEQTIDILVKKNPHWSNNNYIKKIILKRSQRGAAYNTW